mmetsp:Transcript_102756/g.257694  ORF Transcript_102756/g.257694 Transcript_102756/m.257694 type:complete len:823 (+) Transcript_102756:55-2523(+)
MAATPAPDANTVDNVLSALQSSDNVARSQAESLLNEWSLRSDFLCTLMSRAHQAPTVGSRQLAATLLSWRVPRFWPGLGNDDRRQVQSALLDCFATCTEAPVLRALGEACNATCQSIAVHQDALWEDLIHLVANLVGGQSMLHRRASLELLTSLVESMGARLQKHYAEIGHILVSRVYDDNDSVRIAALSLIGTAISSWCLDEEDVQHWRGAAEATMDVATKVLSRPAGDASGPQVLAAALRALGKLVPSLGLPALGTSAAKLACQILSMSPVPKSAEHCQVQALQLLRLLARVPKLLGEQELSAIVPVVCKIAKDSAPDLDDLDEISPQTQTARDSIRAFARVDGKIVLPVVMEFAKQASQSQDALDRAAAIYAVSAAFCGAQEAMPGWASSYVQALEDPTVWVRQSVYEGASMLAEGLRASATTTEGLLVFLSALAKQLPRETAPELVRKSAEASRSIFRELASDECIRILQETVSAICSSITFALQSLCSATNPQSSNDASATMGAVVSLISALGAAASTAADHFVPFAVIAASALVPIVRANFANNACPPHITSAMSMPAVLASCLDAAGAIVASAWAEPNFGPIREEFAGFARQVIRDSGSPSEVRATAHNFFASVALASFEEFTPQLPCVVEAAIVALSIADDGSATSTSRRAVRTGAHEERVAAIDSLGAYAVAVGPRFAAHLQSVMPAVSSQVNHVNPDVRISVAGCLERIGRMLGGLVERLSVGGTDFVAAASMAQWTARSVCSLVCDHENNGAAALRRALQVKEDLLDCPGFVVLLGPEAAQSLAAVGGGRHADDVESSCPDEEDYGLEDAC